MRRVFAGRADAVVAVDAVSDDVGVVAKRVFLDRIAGDVEKDLPQALGVTDNQLRQIRRPSPTLCLEERPRLHM